MTGPRDPIDAALADALLTLDELSRLGAVTPQWVIERVRTGLIEAGGSAADWRFDPRALSRVRCMVRVERDFDAAPELAALVADLIDEVHALRRELAGRESG